MILVSSGYHLSVNPGSTLLAYIISPLGPNGVQFIVKMDGQFVWTEQVR